MYDILQDFPIAADPSRVYRAVSDPALLDEWWTIRSSGKPSVGARYDLDFGPGYQWGAVVTKVRFYHRGWPEANSHYRISCHCWALYLRILRRHIEHGESVPYEKRLDV